MNIEEVTAIRKAFNSVKKRQALNTIDEFEERKRRLVSSRELCVGNEEILAKTIDKLKKNGIKVHLVEEKQEAIDVILDEIGENKLIVKSKSNVTKEIELAKALEKKGLVVVETDIGDRILQVMNAKPSHPTGPVTHLSAREIAKGLSQFYNSPVKE
ncbi:MAG TPA: LUD domain-containing protein, partial [Candidatus Methanoperedens sp.]